MLKKPVFFSAMAVSLILSSPLTAQDVDASTVLATVGGEEITMGHVIILGEALPDEYKNLADDVLFKGIMDQLVQQSAMAQTLNESTLAIDLRLENERRSLMAGAALAQAMTAAVTDEMIEEAYQLEYATAVATKEFNASHILVETEAKAADLVSELNGGANFADLAKEHSTGPSGPNGGELGWFSEGMMVQPFQDAVAVLDDGGVSAPVQTQFGWHVIILNESRVLDAPGIEEVRGDIIRKLQDAAVASSIKSMTDAAEISRVDLTDIDPAILRDLSLLDE